MIREFDKTMLNDYTFLTDHSYSLRPVIDDHAEQATSNRNENAKKKKSRQSSTRTKKSESTVSIINRPASIDRSSSDKENNSLVLPVQSTRKSKTSAKSSTTGRITKKKTTNSRQTRTTMSTTKSSSIKSKKKVNGNPTKNDLIDTTPALSIEERVKLRRTTPIIVNPSKNVPIRKKSSTKKLHSVQEDLKQIRQSMKKTNLKSGANTNSGTASTIKTKKSFLGSGLDLDNIVLGNRQRRHVQT